MTHAHGNRRYGGTPERLRAPERVARLEVGRVVDAVLDGIEARSAVDIGTGSGIFAEAFVARGLSTTGVDVNEQMLEAARSHVHEGRFVQGTCNDIPLADGAVDIAFMGHVLHECEDPVAALREARRVARTRIAILEWPPGEGEYGPPADHRLEESQVDEAARQAGAGTVRVLRLSHMVLYLIPQAVPD